MGPGEDQREASQTWVLPGHSEETTKPTTALGTRDLIKNSYLLRASEAGG